ncbi:MAG: hypothetical protein AB7Q42_20280 [Acidimicrobiia bacterium]
MLVSFQVEGGFANQMRSIVIARDGTATTEVSGLISEKQLDETTVETIVAELDRSGLFDEDRTYPAEGADLQRFEIRYAGATLVAFDTTMPSALAEAVRLLEGAIRN